MIALISVITLIKLRIYCISNYESINLADNRLALLVSVDLLVS